MPPYAVISDELEPVFILYHFMYVLRNVLHGRTERKFSILGSFAMTINVPLIVGLLFTPNPVQRCGGIGTALAGWLLTASGYAANEKLKMHNRFSYECKDGLRKT